jgi:hypothetical protein
MMAYERAVLHPNEVIKLRQLQESRNTIGSDGRAFMYFSEARVGRRTLRKLLRMGLAWQSGVYLSGWPCYQLTERGARKDIVSAAKLLLGEMPRRTERSIRPQTVEKE